MTDSRVLHQMFGLEPDEPAPMQPGEVDVAIDEAGRVVLKLDTDDVRFEFVLEPHAAYNLGFQLIDRAIRACRGSWAHPGGGHSTG
jgi:hypothetical protein